MGAGVVVGHLEIHGKPLLGPEGIEVLPGAVPEGLEHAHPLRARRLGHAKGAEELDVGLPIQGHGMQQPLAAEAHVGEPAQALEPDQQEHVGPGQ